MKIFIVTLLCILTPLFTSHTNASGGFDHGTLTGKGQVQLDLTWNPFDMFDFGQSYAVWGIGLTDYLDFHGYYSHAADGVDQIYYGLMLGLLSTERLDLSTAVGLRSFYTGGGTDLFFPQFLYNIKLDNYFSVGGSLVYVVNNDSENGVTVDAALFIPLYHSQRDKRITIFKGIESIHLGVGVFKPLSGKLYPTYSVDIKFKPWF
jgi:hypothetical protein